MVPRLLPLWVMLACVGALGGAQDSGLTNRAYEILEKQDLVLLGSVLGVLLLLMVVMAVCVYKPLSRR